jgi:hypothetical protein
MNQTIFRAMRSQTGLLRQAKHLEHVALAAKNPDSDPRTAAAKSEMIRRQVRAEVRREERRHNVTRSADGRIVPNRVKSRVVDVPVAGEFVKERDPETGKMVQQQIFETKMIPWSENLILPTT